MSNQSITADKTPWYQWDTGLTVTVSGGEMNECHFANRKQGTAYVQAVINGVARVPDELLQVAAPIKAYGYVSDGAGGQTYIEETFEVIARNIPSDYTYTKTEQKTIRDAEVARDEAVQAAKDAKASELAAADSAVEASTSAQSAGESASAAATSASNAAKSAGDAAKSASDAKAAADSAVDDASELLKTYTDNAKTSADNAATSARNAADAASAASGSATAAAQSATDANSAKVAAQTAKAEAATSASNAATSASNAESSATAAAKSASDAAASVNAVNVIAPKTVDVAASSEVDGSVAVGAGSVAKKENEVSIGNDTLTREITHVSTPTAPTSASNKQYTDDNDAKTLTEAKQYTDANTSNALVGNVSGKLLHVEDAWPCKPLSLTIDGACKQDGTPSPEAPVPITVVENPVLRVTGRNLVNIQDRDVPAKDQRDFFKFGLIPSGTTAYVSCVSSSDVYSIHDDAAATGLADDKDAVYSTFPFSLKIGINKTSITPNFDATKHLPFYGYRVPKTSFHMSNYQLEVGGYHDYRPYTSTTLPITLPAEHLYLAKLPDGTADEIVIDKDGNASLVAMVGKTETAATDDIIATVGTDALSSTGAFADGATVYYKLATPITYPLGKLGIPSLPETISNVWIEADLTPNCSMTYKQDVNVIIADITAQIAALKGTTDIVHDESTASPDDAIDVPDNSETLDVAGTVGEV